MSSPSLNPATQAALNLDSLNPEQRQAVTATDGALLVLAGAGSGKTRVVTTRIAYLILAKKVPGSAVLALTFTNKAAREMSERVTAMVKGSAEKPFIGTFHAFGVQLLRRHIDKLGYGRDFSIYDGSDQLSVVRDILSNLPAQTWFTPQNALYALQRAKGMGLSPKDLVEQHQSASDVMLGAIYREYERILKDMNAIDFEDILQLSMRLSREFPEETRRFFGKYRYVLVDEYQDTNAIQHALLRDLCRMHGNLCVVGDDDQSIYGWRGAEPGNILDFERDYPGARVIRLERNYRSSDVILAAANQLIVHNERRHGKTLRGVRGQGRPLEWLVGEDERDELERVVTHLKITRMRTGAALGDFAILYRSNHQSRGVEELLREEGLPYLLVGGTRFYDRREVKDAIAYLRLVNNPNDEVSLFRVINFPARGIGRTSQTALHTHARAEKRPCIEIMREAELRDEFAPAAATSMQRLAELLDRFRTRFTQEPLGTVLRELLAEIGFHRAVEKEKSDAKGKETAVGLVHEFELATDHFARQNPEGSLKDYLERLALFSMPDENEDYDQGRQVRLMTVHGAKGLEFPMVYVTGMAEDVFPHKRSLDEGGEDEERRLAYVAITRAQQQLVFSMAKARKRYGETIRQQPSRFVLEIEPTLFDGVPPHADGQVPRAPLPEKKAQARGRFFEQIRRMGGDGA